MDTREIKLKIIEAAELAVQQLIKVAREDIIKTGEGDDIAADRLKNAAATKKLAVFDAFEIINRIEAERDMLSGDTSSKSEPKIQGFAERRSK